MKENRWHIHDWLLFGLIQAVVIYIASLILPNNVVLGNNIVSTFAATILNALMLVTIQSLVLSGISKYNLMKKKDRSAYYIYGVVNFISLWILSKLAQVLGMGLSSILVALILALVITFFQYMYWELGWAKPS